MNLSLVELATNRVIKVGDTVTSFRKELAVVHEIHPPHRLGVSGRVTTDLGFHYVGVYNLEFKELS